MKNYLFILLLSSALLLLGSCQEGSFSPSPSADYMILDEVRYVKEFPIIASLDNEVSVNLDVIGVNDFIICDSLLIASTSNGTGFWSLYSLPDQMFLGKFLLKGNGPEELVYSPSVSTRASFFQEEGQFFAGISDLTKGRLLEMNISRSLESKSLVIKELTDTLSKNMFICFLIDNTTALCRELDYKNTQQIRYLQKNGQRVIPANFEKLNLASVKPGEDFNILSTITKFSAIQNRIVEMPIGLNHINIYSLDDSFGRTVCVGERIDNITDIQNTIRWNRMYTYADLRLFDDLFGVLYIGETQKKYQQNKGDFPSIHFFDFDGEPLAELKLNRLATAFDIDFQSGYLYSFDHRTDEFHKYDIRDILNELSVGGKKTN